VAMTEKIKERLLANSKINKSNKSWGFFGLLIQNKCVSQPFHPSMSKKVFSLGSTEFFLSFAFLVSSKQGEVLFFPQLSLLLTIFPVSKCLN